MTFPFVINGEGIIDHDKWLDDNKDFIARAFEEHAAVLFRGFPIHNTDLLKSVVGKLTNNNMISYEGGTSPRDEISEGIYTSTKMPFFLSIPLHSEMVYRNVFPEVIFFFCSIPPKEGGETPIVDLWKVESDISTSLKERVKSNGIIYLRHLKSDSTLRRFFAIFNPMLSTATWQHVFQSKDAQAVELYCKKHGFSYEWQPDNSVILKTHLPGFYKEHWLNSLHFFQVHPKIWGSFITIIFKAFKWLLRGKDMSATDGTGRLFTKQEISEIVNAMDKHKTEFKWQKSDLLMLNNTRVAHGRNPYLGKRKILVSMSKQTSFNAL